LKITSCIPRALPLLLLLACSTPTPQPEPCCEGCGGVEPVQGEPVEPGWVSGKESNFSARYSSRPAPIPLNELFELELEIASDGGPATELDVRVSGWMPDHGHGTNYQARTTELGEGHYRVRGLLFHMPGLWELYVDVVDVTDTTVRTDRLRFEVNL